MTDSANHTNAYKLRLRFTGRRVGPRPHCLLSDAAATCGVDSPRLARAQRPDQEGSRRHGG